MLTHPETGPLSARQVEPYARQEMELYDGGLPVVRGEDPHPSEILRSKSSWSHGIGDYYLDMERKCTGFAGMCAKRRDAVVVRQVRVEPGGASVDAMVAADHVRWTFRELSKANYFQLLKRHLLRADSHGEGVVHAEMIWERLIRGPWAGALTVVGVRTPPMKAFGYIDRVLHYRTDGRQKLLVVPPGKVLEVRAGGNFSPWGNPEKDLAHPKVWAWTNLDAIWQLYLQRSAAPGVRAKYTPASQVDAAGRLPAVQDADTRRQLIAAAARLSVDGVVVLPDGTEMDLMQGGQATPSFESAERNIRAALADLVLAERQSVGGRGNHGSNAADQVAEQSFSKTKVELDSCVLACALERLAGWITQVNFPSHVRPPEVSIGTDELDLASRRAGIKIWQEAGQAVPLEYLRRVCQIPTAREGEPVARVLTPAEIDDVELLGLDGEVIKSWRLDRATQEQIQALAVARRKWSERWIV